MMTYLETRIGGGIPQSAVIPPATEVFGKGKVKSKFEWRSSTFEDVSDNSDYPSPTVVVEKKDFDGSKLSTLPIAEVLRFCYEADRFEANPQSGYAVHRRGEIATCLQVGSEALA
jgi:hypothetical protein